MSSLGTSGRGNFAKGIVLGDMTNHLLQLRMDVNKLLSPDQVDELSRDANTWAKVQRERLLERRNATNQRLKATRRTGHIDQDKVAKKSGAEADRFD